jgi:hypothetical protein
LIILNNRCRSKTAGESERTIMAHTGHRSMTMVREASVFTDNADSGLL